MTNKTNFIEYLTTKKKTANIINKYSRLYDKLFDGASGDAPSIEEIGAFVETIAQNGINGDGAGAGNGARKEAYKFLETYSEFCGESSLFTSAYQEHYSQAFEEPARSAINCLKKSIVMIPEDTVIDPYFLNGLDNEEFIEAFRALQEFVISVYEEIERTSPLHWGWQGANEIAAYDINHNRVKPLLVHMAESGYLDGYTLVVDKSMFWKDQEKKQITPMIKGFMDLGLYFEDFNEKETGTFTVTCPDTPHLIIALKSYTKERYRECCQCHKHDVYPCKDDCGLMIASDHRNYGILSHRFMEKHPPGTHDTEVLMMAVTDSAPPELAKILAHLHEEAARHGFKIMPWTVAHGGCINHCFYTDNWGGKMWMRVGSGTYWGDWFYKMQSGTWAIKPYQPSKPLFKNLFKKHPNKGDELLKRFPDSFIKTGEDYHFDFQNPTFDDVKFILELYKLENNLKPIE